MAVLVALVQLATIGEYLSTGGLFTDDWPIASIHHFEGTDGLWSSLSAANHQRPLGMLYLTVTGAVSGTDPQLHAFWGFLTHLLCVLTVLALARGLGMSLLPATALAVLVLLFPFSDSIWLWYAASHASLAIALGAAGALLALRGLRSRPAWPWHLAAAAALAASVLTYQVIVATVVLMLAVYWPRAERRSAVLLWAKDLAAVLAAAFGPQLITGSRGADSAPVVDSFEDGLRHAEEIADQGVTLLGLALVPFGSPDTTVVVALALCVLLAGSAQAAWARDEAAAHARRWVGWTLAGGAIVITGFAVYVPASAEFYLPLVGGAGNRINALTGIGYSVIVLALAMIVAGLFLLWERWPRQLIPALAAGLVLSVGVGYYETVADDIDAWSRAGVSQRDQLTALERLGRPPPGTTDYVHGGVGETANGVLVFRVSWDLSNAVRLLWDDYGLRAYPVFEGTRMVCGRSGTYPDGPTNGMGPEQGAGYPDVLFTDLRSGERVRIESAGECRRQAARFDPGPVRG